MSLTVRRKVDQWMLLLSKQDMKDLPVEFEGSACPEVPSCLFDYRKLTHMVLLNCHLDVPPTLEGSLNLKTLKLGMMTVDSNISRLNWKRPLLECLK